MDAAPLAELLARCEGFQNFYNRVERESLEEAQEAEQKKPASAGVKDEAAAYVRLTDDEDATGRGKAGDRART